MNLSELWEELQLGRVYECSLRSKTWSMDGLQEGDSIYIDPRPAIIESLLHELLHRRYRRMSERAVNQNAKKLLNSMDEATKAKWWRAYNKLKKKSVPVDVD